MKIAFVTDDGTTISAHFGRAAYYLVVTVEDGQASHREQREKLGHSQFVHEPHEAEASHGPHGFDAHSQGRHRRMMETISDCQVLVARGMGAGAHQNLKDMGIQPILTGLHGVDEALAAWLKGELADHPERLH